MERSQALFRFSFVVQQVQVSRSWKIILTNVFLFFHQRMLIAQHGFKYFGKQNVTNLEQVSKIKQQQQQNK